MTLASASAVNWPARCPASPEHERFSTAAGTRWSTARRWTRSTLLLMRGTPSIRAGHRQAGRCPSFYPGGTTMQPQFNVCYLLHFDRPLGNAENPRGQAQHYLGYADRLDRRALEHLRGHGAKITQALHARGIGFVIARTW